MTKRFLSATSAFGTFPDDSLPVKYALFGYFLPPQMPFTTSTSPLFFFGTGNAFLKFIWCCLQTFLFFPSVGLAQSRWLRLFDGGGGEMGEKRERWRSSGMTVISPPRFHFSPFFFIFPGSLDTVWSPLSSFLRSSLTA